MKKFLIVMLYLTSLGVLAAEDVLHISTEQLDNLGVKLGKLNIIDSAPLMDVPAKVIIPAMNERIVSSLYAGLVASIKVDIGDTVQKGQVLATVNSPEVLTLQREHLTSVNDFKLSEADFLRDKKLYKEKVISDRRWLKTRTSHEVFKSHLNETRQLLKMAGFAQQQVQALEKTQHLRAQLNITAPISGVVLAREVNMGQKVDALAPLFHVADIGTLWLELAIPEQHIQKISVGDKVLLSGIESSARIFLIAKSVDERSQTVLVRAEIESESPQVKLGQMLSVEVRSIHKQLIFQVPNTGLIQLEGQSFIFVRTELGFVLQAVRLLGRDALMASIMGDLQQESIIAVKGVMALKAHLLGLGGDE